MYMMYICCIIYYIYIYIYIIHHSQTWRSIKRILKLVKQILCFLFNCHCATHTHTDIYIYIEREREIDR